MICAFTPRRQTPRCFHYREKSGLEVDAIVQSGAGHWAAFEVKLGESRADQAAGNLLRLAKRVDPKRMGEPRALGVIVSSGYGYTREDGVQVIPIGRWDRRTLAYLPPALFMPFLRDLAPCLPDLLGY